MSDFRFLSPVRSAFTAGATADADTAPPRAFPTRALPPRCQVREIPGNDKGPGGWEPPRPSIGLSTRYANAFCFEGQQFEIEDLYKPRMNVPE